MPTVFIRVKKRWCTCPIAEDVWFISEYSCKEESNSWSLGTL